MNGTDDAAVSKDATILMLAERLYICSRLLTRAAERLGWNTDEVRGLVGELRATLPECGHACVE